MNHYNKRIAILYTADSLKDNNGVYHFFRGLCKLGQKFSWKIDVIFDKESKQKGANAYPEFRKLGANVIFPKSPIADNIAQYFTFDVGISAASIANLQSALFEQLQSNTYDLVIGSPPPVKLVTILSDINIPFLDYTHDPCSIRGEDVDGFYSAKLSKALELLNHVNYLGTQTRANSIILEERGFKSKVLILPLPDDEILVPVSIPKSGILFVGTTEDRKQFPKFFDLIKATGLPAKIMTSAKSATKFKKLFDDAGITNYDIRSHIIGDEKRDFFASSKVFFMPSKFESFGYAFAEAIPHTHAVAFDFEWAENFNKNYCHIIPKNSDYISYIKNLYETDPPIKVGALDYIKAFQSQSEETWQEFLNIDRKTTGKCSKSFVETHRNFYIKDLAGLMGRDNLTLTEINSIIKRKNEGVATITYTDTDTWVSLDNLPVPSEVVDDSPFGSLFG